MPCEVMPMNATTPPTLADDLLRGAGAISVFVYGTEEMRREDNRNVGGLPIFHIGALLCVRKSSILAHIAQQEAAAVERLAAATAAPKAQPTQRPKRPRRRLVREVEATQ